MADTSLAQLRKQAEADGGIGGGGGLPAGTYLAKVVESTQVKNAAGKQQFVLKFEVVGGPEATRSIKTTLTISPESPKALSTVFGILDILGATPAIEREGDPTEVANAMLGSTASLVTYIDDGANFDNVARSKVKYINAAPQSATATPSTTPRTAATPF